MVTDARDVKFPVGLRGYERVAVDRYVREVNRLIAELEISSSPESAVRHALDEVSEETREILQRAHRSAEELTARSRAKADDRLQQAEDQARQLCELGAEEARQLREAAQREVAELRETARRGAQEMLEDAEARARALSHSAETIWRERRRLVQDIRAVGEQLVGIGEAEAKRFPHFAEDVAFAVEPLLQRTPLSTGESAVEKPQEPAQT
jgi:cell division septum initiation protein DivIVA